MGNFDVAFMPSFSAQATSGGLTFLDPQGPVAAAQRGHLVEILVLSLIVVLPVLLLTPWLAWRYRRGNRTSRYAPKWTYSSAIEWVIWGVPAAVTLALGVLLWDYTKTLDPYAPLPGRQAALPVQVVGLDWKWLFIYPEQHVATVGELAFPADRPLALELTTDSVMQSFFVPALGSQIYAMAGMVTRLHLRADRPGRFMGENTQFSGKGFHEQKFAAVAMEDGDFEAWVESVRAKGIALDPATYERLARPSTPLQARAQLGSAGMPPGALYFSDVPAGLFAGIVDKYRTNPAAGAPHAGTRRQMAAGPEGRPVRQEVRP